MAQATFSASIDAAGKPVASNATVRVAAMSKTAVVAAVAVLTADAASPTQGHVATAQAALDAFVVQTDAAIAQVSSNMVVTIDKGNIDTISKLRAAFNAILEAAKASGEFTA